MAKAPKKTLLLSDTASAPAEPEIEMAPPGPQVDVIDAPVEDPPPEPEGPPVTGRGDPLVGPSPTVGRIVHYYENASQAEPSAAIVTKVIAGEGVNLTVFRTNFTVPMTGTIPYIDDVTKDGPCWRWPVDPPGTALPLANIGDISVLFPGATGSTVFGQPKDGGRG